MKSRKQVIGFSLALALLMLIPETLQGVDEFTASCTNIDAIFTNISEASVYPAEYKLGEISLKIGQGYTVQATSGNGSRLADISEIAYDLKVVDNNTGSGTSTGFQTLDPLTAVNMYSSTKSIKSLKKLDIYLTFTEDPSLLPGGTYSDTITLMVASTALTSDLAVSAEASGLLSLSADNSTADPVFTNISDALLDTQYKIGTLTVNSTTSAYTVSAQSLNLGFLSDGSKNKIDYSVQVATNGTAISEGLKSLTVQQVLVTSTAPTNGLPLVLETYIEFTGNTLDPSAAPAGTYTDTITFTISSI